MDNNSEDGTHPKATFGFDHALADIKNTYARGKFPETGKSVNDVMRLFFDTYEMGINPGSPSYMGHMLPALNRIALAAGVIANVLNQNMIAHEVAPIFTQMENQVISFLADLIGYDIMKSGGAIVSGGTNANHTAMLVARNRLLPGVEKHGVHKALRAYNKDNNTDYEDFVIFVGEDAHYSIEKLAGYIGIGSDQVRIIPCIKGSHTTLDTHRLEEMIQEAENNKELVIGISITAGTTEKGNVHNIDDIMRVAKNGPNGKEFYVHVDAAHGGGFLTNDTIKGKLFQGINQADSVTIDGHKMLYTNYGCGGIIFKDQESLGYIKQSAPYVL
ncbi:MAG: pyridoxal-dependent decarboxylase, partial [Candidatus Gracilibacteria bacterium]|nr:pyridoxal-dependent decarboxylase [Candidatus Gracilibacteria bacterium]